jgi:hypothetical protein
MRPIRSKAVKHGLNQDVPNRGLNDDRFVRCKHCGFICSLDRDARAPRGSRAGNGVVLLSIAEYDDSAVTYDGTDDTWTDNTRTYDGGMNDFKIGGGCPLCGCYLYAE